MESKEIPIKKELTYFISKELIPLIEKSRGRICVVAYPDKKYVPYIENVIKTIKDVLKIYNIEVKTLPDTVKPQESNLQTIFNLSKDCILGIVILDGLRPNVVWEYGLLYGLGKPIIVLKDKEAEIDIKNLDDNLKDKLEKHHISNPKLNIDKHLSNVKDLHYTTYDWRSPKKLEEVLKDEIKKSKDKIISKIEILKPEAYSDFQKEFSELAQYIIKFTEPRYEQVNAIHNKLISLARKWKVELSPYYYFELGNIYLNLSKNKEALKAYDKAIEIKPDFAEAWYNKGVALAKLGRYNEALKAYDKAIKIKPDYSKAWYNKGNTLVNLDRYDEALKSFDKAIEIKPDDAKAWFGKGAILDILGRYDEALKSFDKAIEIKPNYADAWYGKGVALAKLDRYDEALKSSDKAIEIKPDFAEAWVGKGVALSNLDRYDEAIKAYDKAIEINPNYADAWFNKGLLLDDFGSSDEAFKAIYKSIVLHADAWYKKARVFSLKGDKENALKNLRKAIELNPKLKEKTKEDEDFKNLWDDEDFKKIVS